MAALRARDVPARHQRAESGLWRRAGPEHPEPPPEALPERGAAAEPEPHPRAESERLRPVAQGRRDRRALRPEAPRAAVLRPADGLGAAQPRVARPGRHAERPKAQLRHPAEPARERQPAAFPASGAAARRERRVRCRAAAQPPEDEAEMELPREARPGHRAERPMAGSPAGREQEAEPLAGAGRAVRQERRPAVQAAGKARRAAASAR